MVGRYVASILDQPASLPHLEHRLARLLVESLLLQLGLVEVWKQAGTLAHALVRTESVDRLVRQLPCLLYVPVLFNPRRDVSRNFFMLFLNLVSVVADDLRLEFKRPCCFCLLMDRSIEPKRIVMTPGSEVGAFHDESVLGPVLLLPELQLRKPIEELSDLDVLEDVVVRRFQEFLDVLLVVQVVLDVVVLRFQVGRVFKRAAFVRQLRPRLQILVVLFVLEVPP